MTPREFLIFSIALLTIYATATLSLFVTPAVAADECYTVQEDIKIFDEFTKKHNVKGRMWLYTWPGTKRKSTISAGSNNPGTVDVSYFEEDGCAVKLRNGQIWERLVIFDDIRKKISQSEIIFENTGEKLIKPFGKPA
jgi:hypothetical protein